MIKLFIVFAFLLFYGASGDQNPLKLTVYYETLCPDSVRFFKTQLNTTYEKIGTHFSVDFVPYGFAAYQRVNGKLKFQCQHGERECNGNKYHACQLAQGASEETNVKFLNCAMSSGDPASSKQLKNCAEALGIDFAPISECFRNGEGDELLVKYGKLTDAVVPKIKYIPTLVINDLFDQKVQDSAEFDLFRTLCGYLDPKSVECQELSMFSDT